MLSFLITISKPPQRGHMPKSYPAIVPSLEYGVTVDFLQADTMIIKQIKGISFFITLFINITNKNNKRYKMDLFLV